MHQNQYSDPVLAAKNNHMMMPSPSSAVTQVQAGLVSNNMGMQGKAGAHVMGMGMNGMQPAGMPAQ